MALTDTAIRNAKPAEKPTKLTDGGGLYLLLNPNGSRWWRLDYRFDGKRRLLVVEYKGAGYVTNDDSKEKRQLGELWEKKSNGKRLFLMAEKQDGLGRGVYDQLAAKIS